MESNEKLMGRDWWLPSQIIRPWPKFETNYLLLLKVGRGHHIFSHDLLQQTSSHVSSLSVCVLWWNLRGSNMTRSLVVTTNKIWRLAKSGKYTFYPDWITKRGEYIVQNGNQRENRTKKKHIIGGSLSKRELAAFLRSVFSIFVFFWDILSSSKLF